jgi:hypothetical protein
MFDPIRSAMLFALLAACLTAASAQAVSDATLRRIPESDHHAARAAGVGPKFAYLFSEPRRWSGVYAWRYNPRGAPPAFSDPEAAVDTISAALDKWSAVCGFTQRYDGETETVPNTTFDNGGRLDPDYENVIGWGELDGTTAGLANVWYDDDGRGRRWLADGDIVLSPGRLRTADMLDRVLTHEWGHVVGLDHSNVDGVVMSGPPDAPYTRLPALEEDDVRGCRCLYGPAEGQTAGYLCSLPTRVAFGFVPVGGWTARPVPVRNAGNAPLVIGSTVVDRAAFRTSGCDPGTVLLPGQQCTLTVAAEPSATGVATGTLSIRTSEGAYRVPLRVEGYVGNAGMRNHDGLWWAAPSGSQRGWGLDIAHQGDTIFAVWFAYAADGNPSWLALTARRAADGSFRGDVVQTRGPRFDARTFDPRAVRATIVGRATLAFDVNGGGIFDYEVKGVRRTQAITRELFGPAPVCGSAESVDLSRATNFQGVWWAAPAGSESGWGVHLAHQGEAILATWFTYDRDGSPLWLSARMQRAPGAATFSGVLERSTGPSFDSAAFDPSRVSQRPVGSMTLTFAHGNLATFSAVVDGVAQSKTITRQIFEAPGTVCR